jgi:hypothetical protein
VDHGLRHAGLDVQAARVEAEQAQGRNARLAEGVAQVDEGEQALAGAHLAIVAGELFELRGLWNGGGPVDRERLVRMQEIVEARAGEGRP